MTKTLCGMLVAALCCGLMASAGFVKKPGIVTPGFGAPSATGACCFAGFCGADFASAECVARGGVYQGDETSCLDAACGLGPQAAINEVRIDQPGPDMEEYFELTGLPGGSLDGLTYLVLGTDFRGKARSGVIESVIPLTGHSINDMGLFVAAQPGFSLGDADLTTELNFQNRKNVTHILVAGFTGELGDDLDENDDGILDER
ncbi:MAG: hypothetical protein ACYSU7_19055, partial [Planctomycetota bacterium]